MLRTTLRALAFIAAGGTVLAGATALANAISTRQPPQAANLHGLAVSPAPTAGLKADRLPIGSASFATSEDTRPVPAPGPTPLAISQYVPAADPGASSTSATDDKLLDRPTRPVVADLPAAKAKAVPTKPVRSTNVILNDAQIANVKERLRLTPAQQQYWPGIEAALRGVVKQIYDAHKKARGMTVPLDTTTPEVERLKTAAMPLLMQLRSDQKAEVMMLARIIGMEKAL